MMSERILLVFSSIMGLVPLLLSMVSGRPLTPSLAALPFVMAMLMLSFLFRKEGRKRMGSLLYLGALLVSAVSSAITSIFFHKALWNDAIVYVLLYLMPLFTLLPLICFRKERNRIPLLLALVLSIAFYLIVSAYSRRYVYLYLGSFPYNRASLLMKTGALSMAVGMISLSLFYTDRNYLNYFALISSSVLFCLSESLSLGGEGWRTILRDIAISPLFFLFIAALLIYIRGEETVKHGTERRNIVFSDMVYQEVKPIRKKPKKQIFEIPPNVPKLRNKFTSKNESEGINTQQSDQ